MLRGILLILALMVTGCAGSGTGSGGDSSDAIRICTEDQLFDTALENAVEIWNLRMDRPWGMEVQAPPTAYCLDTVILHEVGHIVMRDGTRGSEHSSNRDAIMHRYHWKGECRTWLHDDDVELSRSVKTVPVTYAGVANDDSCDMVFAFGDPGVDDQTGIRHLAIYLPDDGLVIVNDAAPWFISEQSIWDD